MSPRAFRIESHDEPHPGDGVLVFANDQYIVGLVVSTAPGTLIFERQDTNEQITVDLKDSVVFLIEGGLPG
jgi:hypothetical protein